MDSSPGAPVEERTALLREVSKQSEPLLKALQDLIKAEHTVLRVGPVVIDYTKYLRMIHTLQQITQQASQT